MATKRNSRDDDNRITLLGLEISGWKFRALAALASALLIGTGAVVGGEYQRWRLASQKIATLRKCRQSPVASHYRVDQIQDVIKHVGLVQTSAYAEAAINQATPQSQQSRIEN